MRLNYSNTDHLRLPDKRFSINDDSMLINMESTTEYDYNDVSDVTTLHSVLGISVRINQDGQFGCAGCLQLFTIAIESRSFLVCLLCHLPSLRVVVFSLLPSFTCLLPPVTCPPATSSLILAFTQLASLVTLAEYSV